MEVLRTTKGINTCYEISTDSLPGEETYVLQMLCNNRFNSLPELTVQWMDGERRLSYKADGMLSLVRKWGSAGPGWKEVQMLLLNLADCIRELQDYLLPVDGILLSAAYLLYDEAGERIRFLYVPGRTMDFSESMKRLMEELMPLFSHGNDSEIVQFYDLYEHFLSGSYTPEMLLQITDIWRQNGGLIKKTTGTVNPVRAVSVGCSDGMVRNGSDPGNVGPESDRYGKPREQRGKTGWYIYGIGAFLLMICVGMFLIFGSGSIRISVLLVAAYTVFLICRLLLGDRDHLGEDIEQERISVSGNDRQRAALCSQEYGMTTSLDAIHSSGTDRSVDRQKIEPDCTALVPSTSVLRNTIHQLVPVESGIRAPLYVSEGYCRIGRSVGENEYCIAAPEISRSHARLECCGSVVTLRDLGSTNGTYINHVRITDSAARELHYGDVVSFAGEEYYVV